MNRTVNEIKNRLSLRSPQVESLEILAEITDRLTLDKTPDLIEGLKIVNAIRPTCADFERNFPSICFSLATGVGKTRLMGAFISYLYIEKGIKNFFVMAPNLTVYDKLIEDFSNTASPKYVFQGISKFVHNQPRIITGDNYNEERLYHKETDIYINIFNISKINAETRAGKTPRIKRLSECLGDSYFNYLSNLTDLVLLMDESHHYRADRGMEVINELKPILGLELTATPQVERSGGAIKFKNVVYEYSLAVAIRDGFVKEPAIATRVDFDPGLYTDEDLDGIKLEDGIRIHEDTKVALDIYARDNKVRSVKPFVLVVTKDVEHARKLKELIMSQSFFDGYYADKVMDIHSSQGGSEKDENIAKLLMLENPRNIIEIVIHVNMLKEGWDVTNLYTIIPLRTATSMTLREQTIGRGLRLPYGKRTGNDKVDKLTIIAHDKFQQIVDEANKPGSIINEKNIIKITGDLNSDLRKEVVTVTSNLEQKLKDEQQKADQILNPEEKQKAQSQIEIKKTIFDTIPELFKFTGQAAVSEKADLQKEIKVKNLNELTKSEVKKIVVEKIKEKLQNKPQTELFKDDIINEVEKAYDIYVNEYIQNSIEIPRIMIHQRMDLIKSGFKDFDLDVKNLNYQPVSEEILIKKLREQQDDTIIIDGSGQGGITPDSLPNLIVSELINLPEIDYDRDSEILFELSNQAIKKFQAYLDEDKLTNVVQYNKKEIARFIYVQMMEHFYCERPKFDKLSVKPHTKIEEHNYSKFTKDSITHYTETIEPTSSIPNKIFSGFKRACHNLYKFDSKTEKDFAIILENDNAVIKWLRPARSQFHIYWDHNSKVYHPDFVVETKDAIYLIETKKEGDIQSKEVQEKALAAYQYCKNATEYTSQNDGKPWKYILIPHDVVKVHMSFDTLVKIHEFKGAKNNF